VREGLSWELTMGGLRARLASDTLLRNGELDLSGVRFVRLGGMVGLSSLIDTWTTGDRPLGVRLPSARVAGYMKRMDVFDILGDRLVYDQSCAGAYTAVQTYRMGGKRVFVAVADAGVGIPATLKNHPEAVGRGIRYDGELIELAAVDGISSLSDERGGGFGSALRSVGNGSGVLTAWSGEGWVRFSGLSGAQVEGADRFRGTCVEAEFRLG
jgi:hypothetical protein